MTMYQKVKDVPDLKISIDVSSLTSQHHYNYRCLHLNMPRGVVELQPVALVEGVGGKP